MNCYRRAALRIGVLVSVVLLAGCSTADDTVEEVRDNLERVRDAVDSQGIFLPAIPIPIDIGEDGRVVKVGGVKAETIDDLAEETTGRPLIGRIAFFDREQIDWYMRSNIQHVTVASRPSEGLFLLVNGRAMPYLAWDARSLDALVDTLGKFQDDGEGAFLLEPDYYDAVAVALPLLHSLGLRFDIRFPRNPEYPEIPLPDEDAFDAALPDRDIEMPEQNARLIVDYEPLPDGEGWVPALNGFSTVDLQDVTEPLDWDVPRLRLRRDIRDRLVAEGIESIGVESRADGVYFAVDGELLPHVAWNETTLTNVAQLLWHMYPKGSELPDDAEWVPVMRATAPMYDDFGMALTLRFPVESSAESE